MGQLVDINPPVGLDLENDDCSLICHAAITKGNVIAVDRTVTTQDGAAVGASNNLNFFTKTRQPTAADVANGIFAVALDTYASGAVGRFRVCGIVDAKVAANVAANAETLLRGTAAATFDLTVATPVTDASGTRKVIAITCNGVAVTAASALCPVYFNGLEGWTVSAT